MFSRRHYEAIAKRFREAPMAVGPLDKMLVAASLADMFARDNERFDRERFIAACRPCEA